MSEHHHEHSHDHHHDQPASFEETLALLLYMLGHNRHHAEELHDLSHSVENEQARNLLHDSVDLLNQSNEKLEAALALLKEA